MKSSIQLRIDWMGPSTNAIYAGMPWQKRKRIADEAHLAVKIAARGCRMAVSAVSISFQPMIRGRRFDTDNYGFSCKCVIDGLVRAGILTDDTNRWVKRIIINAPEKIKKPEQSHMMVTITELE